MKFNFKRKRLTIAGIATASALVLAALICLIVILVIRSDDMKRDKWQLRALNKNISDYIAEGNSIDTADDLWFALTEGGTNLSEDLSPKSAKWGYHYWYDSQNQKVILALYREVAGLPIEDTAYSMSDEVFEIDSPRSIQEGFYLLDMGGSPEDPIGCFLESLSTMKTSDDYKAALESISFLPTNIDYALSKALLERMDETAVINQNGIFTSTSSASMITRIYIPENTTDEEYIITGIQRHVAGEIDLTGVSVFEARIPKSVKVGEFCFVPFGSRMTLYVDVDNAQALGEIFSIDSTRGEIVISTGETFKIENNLLKDENQKTVQTEADGEMQDILLDYRKPVTAFEISSTEALGKGEGAVYIDPKKITEAKPNGVLYAAYNLPSFTLCIQNFNENISSEEISWEEVSDANQLISVDEKTGKVTIERIPEIGSKANYTAVVKATAKAGGYSETIEIYIVRPVSARLNFGAKVLDLKHGDSLETTFDYTKTENVKTFSVEKINYNTAGMVVCDVSEIYTCDTANDDYFSLSANGVAEVRKTLGTNSTARSVSVQIGCLRAVCKISVVDFSYVPIEAKLKNGNYIYKVGNQNALTLGHFFKIVNGKTVNTNEMTFDVLSINGTSILDNQKFGAQITVPNGDNKNWQNAEIRFNGTGICTVEIRMSKDAYISITLEIVNGTNITSWVTGEATSNLVLQSDLVVPAKNYMLNLNKYTMYGNGFIIDAKSVTKNISVDNPATSAAENSKLEDVITISNGALDGVILIGNTYNAIHYHNDANNPYWVHGVNVRKKGTIKNSYIYGFRTPVRVESGTLNMSDTVLEGGCLANLYTNGATALNFNNVTTIQREYGDSGLVGCGLLFANYDGTPVLTITGEFNQYNYVTKRQLTKIGGAEYGLLISNKLSRMTQFKHGNYYHTGILVLGRGQKEGNVVNYKIMPEVQHNLGALGYSSGSDTSEIAIYVKAQLIALDNSACGDCVPKIAPADLTGDGKYDHLDFIFTLGNAVNAAS